MNNDNRNSTIKPTILLMVVIFIIASGYLLFNFYFKNSLNELATQRKNQSNVIAKQVVPTLPVDILQTEQFFKLNDTLYREYAQQAGATPAYYPVPPVPDNITVQSTGLGDSVLITWTAPYDQTYDGVEILRSITQDRRDTKIADVAGTSGSIVDTDVETSTTYYYTLRSWQMVDGEQQFSEFSEVFEVIPTDTVPPAPPKNVTVARNEDNPAELIISWDAIADDDTSAVIVYRSEVRGSIGSALQEVDPAVTQLLDNTVTSGVTYYYTVTARDAAGNESSARLTIAPYGNSQPFIAAESNSETTTNQ